MRMLWGNHKVRALINTDLCALVKGLLDRLITHFGLGSSMEEEPWGILPWEGEKTCLLGRGKPCYLAER